MAPQDSYVTRRRLLAAVLASPAVALLAACGQGQAASSGTPVATATGAPAARATVAPAATTTSSASASATPAATAAAAAQPTGAPAKFSGTFSYWIGLIFSDAANNLAKKTIEDWGAQRGFSSTQAVLVNQNETNQKVAAALQAGTMPDALDMGTDLLLQLSSGGKVVALDDLYDAVGKAHGGWLASADQATDPKVFGGHRTGIPFGTSGNLLNRRKDLLEAKGFTGAPATWQELRDWAVKAQDPPKVYGIGFALSNVGDGNEQVDWLHSWGGRIANDDGTRCTVKSPETKEYLQFVSDAYLKDNLFPPGVTSWDGAGDNNAYQSGKVIFIGNPGSVYLWMKQNDPDLLSKSAFSAFPKGPKLQIDSQSPNVRAIPTSSKQQEAARQLIDYLANDAYSAKYFAEAIYGPVLNDQQKLQGVWSDPIHAGLLDLALHGTGPSYPDVYNAAYAEFNDNFLIPKMVQEVVIKKVSLDQAIDDAQKAGEAIYAKYKKG